METWFEARRIFSEVTEVKVDRVTETSVYIKGSRRNKVSDGGVICPNRTDAERQLIQWARAKKRDAEAALVRATQALVKIEKLYPEAATLEPK